MRLKALVALAYSCFVRSVFARSTSSISVVRSFPNVSSVGPLRLCLDLYGANPGVCVVKGSPPNRGVGGRRDPICSVVTECLLLVGLCGLIAGGFGYRSCLSAWFLVASLGTKAALLFLPTCWFSFQRSPKYLCLWPVCHPVVLVSTRPLSCVSFWWPLCISWVILQFSRMRFSSGVRPLVCRPWARWSLFLPSNVDCWCMSWWVSLVAMTTLFRAASGFACRVVVQCWGWPKSARGDGGLWVWGSGISQLFMVVVGRVGVLRPSSGRDETLSLIVVVKWLTSFACSTGFGVIGWRSRACALVACGCSLATFEGVFCWLKVDCGGDRGVCGLGVPCSSVSLLGGAHLWFLMSCRKSSTKLLKYVRATN